MSATNEAGRRAATTKAIYRVWLGIGTAERRAAQRKDTVAVEVRIAASLNALYALGVKHGQQAAQ